MKLNSKRTFFIGLAFLSISAFWQMYDNVVPLMLSQNFGLDEFTTGIIMSADNVLALFLLPLMGALSDKVNTKLGKRTPFVIVGTILAVIFMSILPYATNNNNLILFIVALAFTLISMALYRSPAVALMPDLTPKPLRSKGNAVINLMGAFGGMLALVFISVLVPKGDNPNYQILFFAISIVMIIAVILLVITTPENKLLKEVQLEYTDEEDTVHITAGNEKLPKEVSRSLFFILISISLWFMANNAVQTAYSRYAVNVWGLEGGEYAQTLLITTIASILSYIPIGIIASKIGRKKTIMAGLVLMLVSFVLAGFFTEYNALINVGFALIGVGLAAVNVNSLPMVVEMSKGSDVGKYTGYYYTFSMSAQIITPILSGYLLQEISYSILFPYCAIFTVLAMCTMSQVKHGDSKPEAKKSGLEHFDVED